MGPFRTFRWRLVGLLLAGAAVLTLAEWAIVTAFR